MAEPCGCHRDLGDTTAAVAALEARLAWAERVVEAAKRTVRTCTRPGMKDPFDNAWQWHYLLQDALTAEPRGTNG